MNALDKQVMLQQRAAARAQELGLSPQQYWALHDTCRAGSTPGGYALMLRRLDWYEHIQGRIHERMGFWL